MTDRFVLVASFPTLDVDPASDKDYSIGWEDWLDGDTISSAVWTITPQVEVLPTVFEPEIYGESINTGGTLTIDGRTYAASTVTSAWIRLMTAAVIYIVQCTISTAGGRTEARSFRLRCVRR